MTLQDYEKAFIGNTIKKSYYPWGEDVANQVETFVCTRVKLKRKGGQVALYQENGDYAIVSKTIAERLVTRGCFTRNYGPGDYEPAYKLVIEVIPR